MSEERTVNGTSEGGREISKTAEGRREESRGRKWLGAAVLAGTVWAMLYLAAMLRIPYDGKECLVEDALMLLVYWVGLVLIVIPLSALALLAEWKLRPGVPRKAMTAAGMLFFAALCAWGVPKLELWARMKMREARKTGVLWPGKTGNLGSMLWKISQSDDSPCGEGMGDGSRWQSIAVEGGGNGF